MAEPEQDDGGRTVVFFHPDLGIGGAERLIIDAAVGLQQRGAKVVIFTSHCDPRHCFDEARDGTLDVRVRGGWLFPPSVFNRLTILCAILRQLLLLAEISFSGELAALKPTVLFVDQLSAGLPLLRWRSPDAPVFFYCHFPDQLLARGRASALKRLYRAPFDAWEEWSMSYADAVAVNSEFTRGVVAGMWPRLAQVPGLQVVYPCVDAGPPEDKLLTEKGDIVFKEKVILSINRFERKKDVALAVRAFAALPEAKRKGARLVIAGGYDPRVSENVEYLAELQSLADSLSLKSITTKTILSAVSAPADVQVLFLQSIPNRVKRALLRSASLLVYTPANEHFGIAPLEAMLAGLPVLAANTGGPTESVLEAETGWLRDPADVPAWTTVMGRALAMPATERDRMAAAGRRRAAAFSRDTLARRLDGILDRLEATPRKPPVLSAVLNFTVIFATFGLGLAASRVLGWLSG